MLTTEFFSRHPLTCATDLVGCELVWEHCSGIVVETEAYTALGDESCHTFLRRGAQHFVDTNPAGTAYIYLNYGIHWLLNVLIKSEEMNGFVLVRALEPRRGIPFMQERRGLQKTADLCSGPGKLTQALGLPATFHGASLCKDPAHAFHARPADVPQPALTTDVRIGISKAADFPWRFLATGNRYVSKRPTLAATPYTTTQKEVGQFQTERPDPG